MHGLFNYDSTFIQTLNKAADCVCLSLLWIVSSLPVVTAGAATTALYYATNKCIRRSQGGIWASYWQSFRQNWKQATGIWLILLVLCGLLGASCYSACLLAAAGQLPREMTYFLLAVIAVVLLWASFLFPYLARFQADIRTILKNCVYMALMNFPVGLLNLVLLALSVLASLVVPLAILCAPGIYMVLSCYAMERVFRKYMAEEDRAREAAEDQD